MSDKVNKVIDQVVALSVLELAELVKSLEEKFGVTASTPTVAAQAATPVASPTESEDSQQSSFTVIIKDAGAQKIQLIKAIREINPNLGLKEAKDLSEKPGSIVAENVNKAAAEEAKAKLSAAGATVELK